MSVLSVIKEVQQSVPIPLWKVKTGNIGTGVFVSTEVCNEWTFADYKKRQTWCIFGTGEGYVYFELAKRLVDAGHSPKTVFTSGMLVGYDIDIDCVNILKEKIEHTFGIDKSQIAVYNKNYFTLEKTVNFDNFIINSPYLDGSKGNIPVSHKHIGKALEHWNGNGKGFAITKSSPALSDERYGDEVRNFVTSKEYNGFKARFLPDDAFPNAIVRSWYLGFDKTKDNSVVEVCGKDGNLEYMFDKSNDVYIFNNFFVKNILSLVKTEHNIKSLYDFKRNDNVKENKTLIDTVTLIANGKKTIEKTKTLYRGYGNYSVGITFQVNGDVTDAYRSHTHNSCLILPTETLRKDYSFIVCKTKEEAESLYYQIRHPLNAWIHAHTRTSDQSSRGPQFKFCCRIPTVEFYNLWPEGNPSVSDYFDYWKIPTNYQTEILDWYCKYG